MKKLNVQELRYFIKNNPKYSVSMLAKHFNVPTALITDVIEEYNIDCDVKRSIHDVRWHHNSNRRKVVTRKEIHEQFEPKPYPPRLIDAGRLLEIINYEKIPGSELGFDYVVDLDTLKGVIEKLLKDSEER